MRQALLIAAIAACVLPIATAATTEHAVELHELGGGAMHLYAEEIRAKAGDTLQVTVTNPATNALDHNLVFCGQPAAETAEGNSCTKILGLTPMLKPGESRVVNLTVSEAGTYEYWCQVFGHKGATPGMKGTLIVEEAATKESPAPALAALAGLAVAALVLARRR